jgi:hypothetical protein
MNRFGVVMPRDGPKTHRDRARTRLKSLTIRASDRLQYVSQRADVRWHNLLAIAMRRFSPHGICLAFDRLRTRSACAVHEDLFFMIQPASTVLHTEAADIELVHVSKQYGDALAVNAIAFRAASIVACSDRPVAARRRRCA